MIQLAVRELASRRIATSLAVVGVTTAVLGFAVLAATSQTTSAVLTGDVARTWGGPYQLLVRPEGARSELEQREGLIRPNYFSGLVGGITLQQLRRIKDTPGVDVAAPIALVGFVQWPASWAVGLGDDLGAGLTVLRITYSADGEAGLSHYPLGDQFLISAPGGRLESAAGRASLHIGASVIPCTQQVRCYDGTTLAPPVLPAGSGVASVVAFGLPIVVAGVDPTAEAALAGLGQCVTSGRYLTDADVPVLVSSPAGAQTAIPILVSQSSFIDETIHAHVARAADAAGLLQGLAVEQLTNWESVGDRSARADELYRSFIGAIGSGSFYNVSPVWSPGEVSYESLGADQLRARVVGADLSVFANPLVPGADLAPQEARDVWFRQLVARPQVRRQELPNAWIRVGQYDPTCLPSFDALAGGAGIDAYALPAVDLPSGARLGPTRSMAGYVNSPPLIMTTLSGAQWFADPQRFQGATGDAFISAVRVRIAGTAEAGPAGYARLARAAAAIHDATGLAVDIVVGSSPRPISVELAPGTFGRPTLSVREGWAVQGVAYRFTRAVQAQDVALFGVALLGSLALVAQTAFVSVRRRRHEFAVLRALGWRGSDLARLVLLEVLVVGLLSGFIAILVGLPLIVLTATDASTALIVGVLPLALVVSLGGGILPALAATRSTVTAGMRMGGTIRRSRLPRHPWRVGADETLRRRGADSVIPIAVVAISGTLLGAMIAIEVSFRGQLDTTVLGVYLAGRVQPFHLAVAALTLAIGALAAAQAIALQYLERQPALAMLRAIGWRKADVVAYVAGDALALAALGAVLAAGLVGVLMLVLNTSSSALVIAVSAAVVAPLVAITIATAGTLVHAFRISPATLLRGE